VTLGVTLCVRVCVRRAATARCISVGGEGNVLYPVLSSYLCRSLAIGEGNVVLAVCVCVHPAATARGISLSGEGSALSSLKFNNDNNFIQTY